jgi:hypothetical protein
MFMVPMFVQLCGIPGVWARREDREKRILSALLTSLSYIPELPIPG